ncbi:MAG: XTP/dITP diphosphatase [Lachnospiraceae bacterium]|nr:XTP/dITP diphosphatase [Lachnospiraceae bacterium]MBP3609118.1 XTP/dITP diphosphatase [Lachnospiraceae bacterium]
MKKIIFATSNEGKMKEIRLIMQDSGYEVVSLKEAGISVDIVEDGTTFEENAVIKASAIAKLTGELAMADDSGLEVDYMDKAPGIYSARFLGEDTDYTIKNTYILDKLKDVPREKRTARFVCAIALAKPDGTAITRRETIEGYIGYEIRGENGFGYDPIFMVPEFEKTTAELTIEEKNKISHRAKALRAMKEELTANA